MKYNMNTDSTHRDTVTLTLDTIERLNSESSKIQEDIWRLEKEFEEKSNEASVAHKLWRKLMENEYIPYTGDDFIQDEIIF